MYQQVLPLPYLAQLRQTEGLRQNNRVYNDGVVMWLMLSQRLQQNGTLEDGVLELIRGLPASFWPNPCARIRSSREGNAPLSDNTGSYNDARQQLPVTIVEQSCDHVFQQLMELARPGAPTQEPPTFFLDGTTVRTPPRPELRQKYPPASNQHGDSPWPLIRMLAAHDLDTGLALRPEWDSQKVSEQDLLQRMLNRLPDGAITVGDTNFGVFSVAYSSHQSEHPVLLRMQLGRARRICPEPFRDGIDRRICWKPTAAERKKHRLPADACVHGRLIVRQVQPSDKSDPFLLVLFTTLDWDVEALLDLYAKRWHIETDLRHLKCTLQLEQLTSTSVPMVSKDIPIAMLAYNLVRAITLLAARQTGSKPRTFSFARVSKIIRAFAPLIGAAGDQQEAQQISDRMSYYVRRAKIRNLGRTQKSYPREVLGKPQVYAKRKAAVS